VLYEFAVLGGTHPACRAERHDTVYSAGGGEGSKNHIEYCSCDRFPSARGETGSRGICPGCTVAGRYPA
jgi:hypothetical protein